ncbi:prominin-1-A-like isoform X2 [Paramormyrops kingsleyae]|uniref:prominin-1-A-like isoform X2 n=1 Tax=Paramormyrops kingsleyae TaxID=1676925 RepID=UPI003B97BD0F
MVAKVVLLFLLCRGAISGQLQATTQQGDSAALQFESVPPAVYETPASYNPGPMDALFYMVHTFLHVVQPNPFPEEIIVQIIQGDFQSQYSKPENVVLMLQAAHYEMGFLVCAALGLLFMVLMPLVGFCFCVCRCCENCGGEMHQRQRKNADCRRSALAGALFVTSLLITAGVVIAYAANQNLSDQLKGVRRLVNSNMKDLQTLVNQTPVQIDYLIGQYNTTKEKVISDLDNVAPLLGREIYDNLASECLPALDRVSSMASDMRETQRALLNMNLTLEVLQKSSSSLQANLSLVNTSIKSVLNDSVCKLESVKNVCMSIRDSLSQLCIHANFSRLPSVNQQLTNVTEVLKPNLSSIVQKGNASFNNIPDLVKNQTNSTIKGVRNLLDGIGTDITSFSKKLPLQANLRDVSNLVNQVHSRIEDVYPQIDRADFYRWTCCVTLCCLVLLILTFTFLGLLCGGCGYDRHASPTTRGCVSNTGGNLLMAGAGFTFIFSWVLMAFVTLTFVVGGNVEKLFCEPLESQQLFKVIDTPYLLNHNARNFIPALLIHNPEVNLTAGSLYSKCKENRGIYSALQLDNVFNLTAYLDISAHSQDIAKQFDSVSVDLNSIILLEPSGKENLLSFNKTGVDKINYPEYLAEVNKSITVVDLLVFADNLENQLNKLPQELLGDLRTQVSYIRDIHNKQVIPMQHSTKYVEARTTLSQSVQRLQSLTSNLPSRIADTLKAIDSAQNITHNATHIITQETGNYRDRLIGYFEQYINWVKTSLAMDVASCKPISNLVDSVDLVACSFVVDSLNLFWFGLGWATVLLIPSLILSVRLAKFYRRMDTEDVYDDMEIGINGYHNEPSLSMQSTIPMSEIVPEPLPPYPFDSIPPGFSSSVQDRLVRASAIETWN